MNGIVLASVLGLVVYAVRLTWEPKIRRTDYDAWGDLRFVSTLFAGLFCLIVFVVAVFSNAGAGIWDDLDTALSIHGRGSSSIFFAGACVTFAIAVNIHVLILWLRARSMKD
jgi:hypothetical protein